MTEALEIAPGIRDGSIPLAQSPDQTPKPKHDNSRYPPPVNYANIPKHLINATDKLGTERGEFVENRLLNILSPYTMIIERIERNGFGSEEDKNQHDLSGILVNGEWFHVQGKSDRSEIVKYKREIADKIFRKKKKKHIRPKRKLNRRKNSRSYDGEQLIGSWAKEAAVSEYLTDRRIILLNGTQYKSDDEILDSFYPQLDRILTRISNLKKRGTNVFGDHQPETVPKEKEIQVFPSAAGLEPTQLFP